MAAAPETDLEQVSYAQGSAPLESQKRPLLQVPEVSGPSGEGLTEQGADVQSKRWDPSAGLTSRAWGSSLPCRAGGGPHACPRTRTLQPGLPLCSSHSKRLWSPPGTRPFPHHLKASQNPSSESENLTTSPQGPGSLQFHSSYSGHPCPRVPTRDFVSAAVVG